MLLQACGTLSRAGGVGAQREGHRPRRDRQRRLILNWSHRSHSRDRRRCGRRAVGRARTDQPGGELIQVGLADAEGAGRRAGAAPRRRGLARGCSAKAGQAAVVGRTRPRSMLSLTAKGTPSRGSAPSRASALGSFSAARRSRSASSRLQRTCRKQVDPGGIRCSTASPRPSPGGARRRRPARAVQPPTTARGSSRSRRWRRSGGRVKGEAPAAGCVMYARRNARSLPAVGCAGSERAASPPETG
jgi:hypothetical protein